MKNRTAILNSLQALPLVTIATHGDVLQFMDGHKLWGAGLGWIDLHLLTSSLLSDCRFWTLDKRLAQAAVKFHMDRNRKESPAAETPR